jgi:dipeptidyl aminopeptidase/acylaminoacyl peptidase
MPQETKAVPQAVEPASPAGWTVDLSDQQLAFDALEKAFDYRGDVALDLADGRTIVGYLFDRRKGNGLADSSVRLLCPGSDDKVAVTYADIRRIAFSDRDPAAGKSFDTWIKKYIEKKLAGEKASIESETLD